ncbi:SAM-dependent methyltransferase [Aliikangiella sp. IMCC44359]|uniref:SAM-dependent methyltransferase n=1 Tax=Aliikangiella sp. IMCC44359 TaxID=3459125 RepID=UPI00403B106F
MHHSKIVTSNQSGLHEKLNDVVIKHIENHYRKPYRQHNLDAFLVLQSKVNEHTGKELILDSCCGTAMSSITFAKQNPNCFVVGIDQSHVRLNKNGIENRVPDNCLLLRANCEDIWRLCVQHEIIFDKHFILYPNPWPKSIHLIRRWHGHPIFPYLLSLSKTIILRSNWRVYLEEFSQAWFLLSGRKFKPNQVSIDKAITLFEKKYNNSQQIIYELKIN